MTNNPAERVPTDDPASWTTGQRPSPGVEWRSVSQSEFLAEHWGLVLSYGVLTLGFGVVLAAWPGETVKVVAFLLAFQLIISGCAQLFLGLVPSASSGATRLLLSLAGVAAILAGVLLLFSPLQTLTVVAVFVGVCSVVAGLADLLTVLARTGDPAVRAWDAVRGAVGLAAGLFLVAYPDRSLRLLVVVVCLWLIVYGSVTILAAFRFRSGHTSRPGVPA